MTGPKKKTGTAGTQKVRFLDMSISSPAPNELVDVTATGNLTVEGNVVSNTYDQVAIACFEVDAVIPYPPTEPTYQMIPLGMDQSDFSSDTLAAAVVGLSPTGSTMPNNCKLVAFALDHVADPASGDFAWDPLPTVRFYAYQNQM